MKKTTFALSLLALVSAAASVPALAGTVYSSGPSTYSTDAWSIEASNNATVSNEFTLSSAETITGATFAVWTPGADIVTGTDWSFGSSMYGTDLGSGTATTSQSFIENGKDGFEIYEETITLPSMTLAAGSYWFSLSGATDTFGDRIDWDENDGSSIGYTTNTYPDGVEIGEIGGVNGYNCAYPADGFPCPASGGETFTLTGSAVTATPEPSSFLLLGSGLAGIAGLIRRKFKA